MEAGSEGRWARVVTYFAPAVNVRPRGKLLHPQNITVTGRRLVEQLVSVNSDMLNRLPT